MPKLTFSSYLSKLKNNQDLNQTIDDAQLMISAIQALIPAAATAAAAGAPAAVSVGAAAVFKWLSDKGKVIDFGQRLWKFIQSHKPKDYSDRIEKMETAYASLCFMAFFDELNDKLPDAVRQRIALSSAEEKKLFKGGPRFDGPRAGKDEGIILPDVTRDILEDTEWLETLYRDITERFQGFVQHLSFPAEAPEREIRAFEKVCKKLPEGAVHRFKGYYLKLCAEYNEFYIFTQWNREKAAGIKADAQYQTILSFAMGENKDFKTLPQMIHGFPKTLKKEEAILYARNLAQKYQTAIDQPVIGRQDEQAASGNGALVYPPIREIFIPQAYRQMRFTGKERLDHQSTWDALGKPQKDMTAFLAKYILAPASAENVLLILGEPGAGKSLLTKMLCGQLNDDGCMFIRIPLREHSMEDEIESIVLEQLNRDCDPSTPIPTLKWFQEEFPNNPLTLLFDGFDEVLQATGGVYQRTIQKIQEFQTKCMQLKRPVRVVITSRDTLIHKALIPIGTQVMRLDEFDEKQRNDWIGRWNEYNRETLADAGLEAFSLPENAAVIKLASQPLLLTMLAIYDADFDSGENALKKAESLNRTRLYNELLRRFVKRELKKGARGGETPFDELDGRDKTARVDDEMQKLGIVALGMFAREKLFVQKQELENDLKALQIKSNDPKTGINTSKLDSASALLGSFFFIHAAKYEADHQEEMDGAFEFMHKTFYEFLLADIALQSLMTAAGQLRKMKSIDARFYSNALEDPANKTYYDEIYYAVLSSACFCREPEAVRMIAEWKAEKLTQFAGQGQTEAYEAEIAAVTEDLFHAHFDYVKAHGVFSFTEWERKGLIGEKTNPQRSAVYLMNLLSLLLLTRDSVQIQAEDWDWLSQYLKLHIPLPCKKEGDENKREWQVSPYEEIVLQFMSMFDLDQDEEAVVLRRKTEFTDWGEKSLLDAKMSVCRFMRDDVTRKVYVLHDEDMVFEDKMDAYISLHSQGARVEIEASIAEIKKRILIFYDASQNFHNRASYEYIGYLIREEGFVFNKRCQDASLLLEWLRCLSLYLNRAFSLKRIALDIAEEWSNSFILDTVDAVRRFHRDYPEILLAFFDIVNTLLSHTPCQSHAQNDSAQFAADILSDYAESSPESLDPDVCAAILKFARPVLEWRERTEQTNYGIRTVCQAIVQGGSIRAIVTCLNILVKWLHDPTLRIIRAESLQAVQRRWKELFGKYPYDLPSLLLIYLKIGAVRQVNEFSKELFGSCFFHERRIFYNETNKAFFDAYLPIAQATGTESALIQCVQKICSDLRGRHTLVGNLKLLDYVLAADEPVLDPSLIRHGIGDFLERFQLLFGEDPEHTALVLCGISEHPQYRQVGDLSRAWFRVLPEFIRIIDLSLKSGLRVLQAYYQMDAFTRNKLRKMDDEMIHDERSCLVQCLNAVLARHDISDAKDLNVLLNSLDTEIIPSLRLYFRETLPFFRCYSEKTANVVESLIH